MKAEEKAGVCNSNNKKQLHESPHNKVNNHSLKNPFLYYQKPLLNFNDRNEMHHPQESNCLKRCSGFKSALKNKAWVLYKVPEIEADSLTPKSLGTTEENFQTLLQKAFALKILCLF